MRKQMVISLIDQATISAFNFFLNIYFIKLWSPEDFGFYAVIAAIAISTSMIQNAVINTPLAVHLPIAKLATEKTTLIRVFSAANSAMCLVILAGSWGGFQLWLGTDGWLVAGSASLYIATQFAREYYRSLLAIEGRLRSLLIADVTYVMLSSASLGFIGWQQLAENQSLPFVLLILTSTGLFSIVWYIFPRAPIEIRGLYREVITVFSKQMHEIRWSLLGVITTDIQNRGYIFVAAAVFGTSTVAHLQAGRIFYGPLNLITGSWARVARPQLAKLWGDGDSGQFSTLLSNAVWIFIGFNIMFLTGLWFAWPYLSDLVFHGKYAGLEFMIAGWGLANLAFQVRSCLSVGVQALRQFRQLTMATIWGAALSVLIVAVACALNMPLLLIASVIAGECVAIIIVLKILRSHTNHEK